MTQTPLRKRALTLLFLLFSSSGILAQIATGGITGTVHDQTGAVVPNAKITLTNDSTGVTNSTVSTSTGTYSLTGVMPGSYTLQGEANGFQTFVESGLQVHVQATLTVDMPLVAGKVANQVTVTAAAPLLQSESASVGQTITSQAINDMPLQTRDWVSLAQLSAGVNTAPVGNPSSDSGESDSAYFSVDGVNLWQNDFRLDGINDNIEVYGVPRWETTRQSSLHRMQSRNSSYKTVTSTRNSDTPPVRSSMLSSNPEPTIFTAICGSTGGMMHSMPTFSSIT